MEFSTDESSIEKLISESREKKLDLVIRKAAIDKAYKLVLEEDNTIEKSKLLQKISNTYLNLKDSTSFKKTNKVGKAVSTAINDSITLANHHWNLGFFYNRNSKKDSAFYFYDKAKNIFDELNPDPDENVARLLLNMARIQKDLKDYTGSEVTTFAAIRIFEVLEDYSRLYYCYNNLGIIFKNLEDYDKSLEYHNTALSYLKKIEDNDKLTRFTLNDIGLVYRYQGKYEDAINNFKQALAYDSLYIKDPKQYARLLDNLAYTKFLSNDVSELPDLFYTALKIRDSIKYESGVAVSKMHLAEYFLEQKDTIQSLKYVSEARKSAIESNNVKQKLNSLLLSSKIDDENGTAYLNTYIHINDSLIKHERKAQNKFARIRFETDKYISRNEKLNVQINWIVAISSALVFFSFLIYVITQQRTRNKELEMEQQQQRANEEIYNLMIDQQDKIEEGRKREKERISLELHDGILGRLFGTRLSLGSLNAKDDANSKKTREQYINELQSIEEEVRNISHELGLDNFDTTTSYSTMITNLLEEQSKITNFKYQIEDDDRIVWTDIPGHIKINIYRIIQESVQNINKYAKAKNVILDFKKNDNHIILTIKDDGVGFNQEKRSSGIGLKNMRSRVTLLHGQFTINSVPGKGTSISVDVPMT
ncbi:tetratricopeptide repeat-containing sensor histidine kinase [Kordia jejudonensis]|uniref:tetratricopeptide repeat-containing sensor histidine kinase n=1 Tax=Kordia jejudonensis TaxID=1348245 RepID=UPI00062969BF|nr:sensor histidine kinase [Kordia jejudonensis]